MIIAIDDLSSPDIANLLAEHLQSMAELSPAENVHALDIDALRRPEIIFWSGRKAGHLMGCAALLQLDQQHAEIKSMRTATAYLRQGVAAKLLQYVMGQAKERGYRQLSLETGSTAAFEPARRLYSQFGFGYCEPFADYQPDPHSVFMSRAL